MLNIIFRMFSPYRAEIHDAVIEGDTAAVRAAAAAAARARLEASGMMEVELEAQLEIRNRVRERTGARVAA
jgi:hypothetical protein